MEVGKGEFRVIKGEEERKKKEKLIEKGKSPNELNGEPGGYRVFLS